MESSRDSEKQNLMTRLLDAVKQCQIRFGGKSELATESDSRVSILCGTWESVLQHGLKHSRKALSTIKQVTEITGITKIGTGIGFVDDFRNLETEPTFWTFIKDHLNRHDLQRYSLLKVIWTDAGRGRAWLRATLNEHSLEKYMHMLVESSSVPQYYEDWAFMCDQERACMLPNMAAGLGSILFAISIDNEDLNSVQKASGLDSLLSASAPSSLPQPQKEEPRPVIANHPSVPNAVDRKKAREKKRKKKVVQIVSFDEDDLSGSSAVASPLSLTSAVDIPSPKKVETSWSTKASITEAEVQDCVGQLGIDEEVAEVTNASLKHSDSVVSADSMIVDDLIPVDAEGREVVTRGHHRVVSVDLKSESSLDISDVTSSYSERALEAHAAVVVVQEGLNVNSCHKYLRTEGDGSNAPEPASEGMNESELKQALVAMMQHKDGIEDNNRMLRVALEQEQSMTQALRTEIQEMRQSSCARQQRDSDKLKNVTSENELLKHQLKKYVSAVQMLRRQGASTQDFPGIHVEEPVLPPIPAPPSNVDYCHEASEYERKLIQVAEMHGELIEFNEVLQRQLVGREQQLRQLRAELVSLRGPLPEDATEDSWSIVSAAEAEDTRPLINIWIPSAFLRGVGSDAYHVYQVYVRVRDDEWNIYRRYSEFHDLHSQLKKKHPSATSFEFPKKKTLGSKDPKLVENRRQKLQQYLRSVVNLVLHFNQDLSAQVSRAKLQETVPFFRDSPNNEGKKGKSSRHNSSAQHYNGL
ncbi:hypothetical protein CAPTEDRAFT_218941 [Capitella teleta]|uniref:Sorting nexin-29 n=1 Tax=Capitella teleta TaxID=283909 RepID=R7V8G7_CAPTE|nr:hypothetical protein CAPTEDRAFT_218941 [Capitella teleta]|eukprot:ELU12641.1 hypothetical protein CAPTEDRAFT_218941 [Capitella teleta]